MQVKETQHDTNRLGKAPEKKLGQTVFNRTEHEKKPAPSVKDTIFIKIMDTGLQIRCQQLGCPTAVQRTTAVFNK